MSILVDPGTTFSTSSKSIGIAEKITLALRELWDGGARKSVNTAVTVAPT